MKKPPHRIRYLRISNAVSRVLSPMLAARLAQLPPPAAILELGAARNRILRSIPQKLIQTTHRK